MNSDLMQKLKELRNGYINKLRETFPNFKDLLNENPIRIEEIYLKIHTISGTSGMYGLKDLSNASTEFEFYLKPLKENPAQINMEELRMKFLNYLECIEKVISVGE